MRKWLFDLFGEVYQIIRKHYLLFQMIEIIIWCFFIFDRHAEKLSFCVWIFLPYHVTLTFLFLILIIGNIHEFFLFANTHKELFPNYPKNKFSHLWDAALSFHRVRLIFLNPTAFLKYIKIGKKQISYASIISFFMIDIVSKFSALCWYIMIWLPLYLYIPKGILDAHIFQISCGLLIFGNIFWFILHASRNVYAVITQIDTKPH